MPSQKSYAFTDLGDAQLRLDLNGIEYPVTQYVANFAMNQIPTAQCYLAVGRMVNAVDTAASTHMLSKLIVSGQMTPAKVYFGPKGEYSPDGTEWPNKGARRVIFDGYLSGISTRKVTDKFIVVVGLIHWLIDLDCSSALTKHGHASNISQMNAAAVWGKIGSSGGGQGSNIGQLAVAELIEPNVAKDVWASIKLVFCRLAAIPTQPTGPDGECGGPGVGMGEGTPNDRAMLALARIEGPAGSGGVDSSTIATDPEIEGQQAADAECSAEYADGVALALDTASESGAGIFDSVQTAIANAIANETVESYSSASFWSKLIQGFCPAFGMAVVPMVNSAIVIADVPGYRGGIWRTIVDEYDSLDFSAAIERPLRGVGVVGQFETQTMAPDEDPQGAPPVGGCFTVDSVAPGDGMLLYVAPPDWLSSSLLSGTDTNECTGVDKDEPARAAGADAKGAKPESKTKETLIDDYNKLYTRYAHLIFVNNMLRGRMGTMSGKLRFDIAPGSMVRIKGKPEPFVKDIAGEDTLSATMVGCVSRVSIAINAEGPAATTSFEITNMRLANPENKSDRTSVDRHPLFGKAIHGGGKYGSCLIKELSPEVPELDFGEDDDA